MAKKQKTAKLELAAFYHFADLMETPKLFRQSCSLVYEQGVIVGFVGSADNPLILMTKTEPSRMLAYVDVTANEFIASLEEAMFRATFMQFHINKKVLLGPHKGDTRKTIAIGKPYQYI